MALLPNTLMDVDIDFFALGKDRLNISSLSSRENFVGVGHTAAGNYSAMPDP
ncbi:hypothetical protein DY000_02032892 [Brassica cretica]|uniref:Legume lectin domain-containing protein n=1 Tax=Brassica cretica TaxID=69181 RepID=A0ABQ7DGJ9_BRACR|nr:hypothetical protein DY000_02032892 [Brassica cretica]